MYEEKSYQFVDYLIRDTILPKQGAINVPPLQRPVLPANIAPTPQKKEDIIEQHMSRFHYIVIPFIGVLRTESNSKIQDDTRN